MRRRPSLLPPAIVVFISLVTAGAAGAAPPQGSATPCQVVEQLRAFGRGDAQVPPELDWNAISDLVQQLPGPPTSAADIRLGELVSRLNATGSRVNCGITGVERLLMLQAASVIMGGTVRAEEIKLGDLVRRVGARPGSSWQAISNAAKRLRDAAGFASASTTEATRRRHALQLQYAEVDDLIYRLRRQGVGGDDSTALYQEAFNRLLSAHRDELVPLLDGHRSLAADIALIDAQSLTLSERTEQVQAARLAAFGPALAKDLFEREELLERYDVERHAIEADVRLSANEKSEQIAALRQTLKVELASMGSFVGFVDEAVPAIVSGPPQSPGRVSGAQEAARPAQFNRLPASLQEMVREAEQRNTEPVTTSEAALVSDDELLDALATTTSCDTDPQAVDFQATVDPSLLNALLGSLPPISLNRSVNVSFRGLCVTHNLSVSSSGQLPIGGSRFTVTPTVGKLRVDLDFGGALAAGLAADYTSATSCNTGIECAFGAACGAEQGVVSAVLDGRAGSFSATAVRVTQIADTCVLGNCTAVHPLDSNNATLSNFVINLFGSCGVTIPIINVTINPCADLNSLVTTVTNWLVNFQNLVAGFFVDGSGKGLLIEVFHSDIVSDGCLPIPEIGQCMQGVTDAAGLIRGPKSSGINGLLYTLPVLVSTGAVIRLRRRRRSRSREEARR